MILTIDNIFLENRENVTTTCRSFTNGRNTGKSVRRLSNPRVALVGREVIRARLREGYLQKSRNFSSKHSSFECGNVTSNDPFPRIASALK